MNTIAMGWLFKEVTDRGDLVLKVKLKKQNLVRVEKDFSDSGEGYIECAEWITARLCSDDWTLEDMHFMGYRIRMPREQVVLMRAKRDWDDNKAEVFAECVKILKPAWRVSSEYQATVHIETNESSDPERPTAGPCFVLGNANQTLGANGFRNPFNMEHGEYEEGLGFDTGMDADNTPVDVLAGKAVGMIDRLLRTWR